jgi:hypothetical protein
MVNGNSRILQAIDSRFNRDLIFVFLAFNFLLMWFLTQILNVNAFSSKSFFALDSNCPDSQLNSTKHCFGDFTISIRDNSFDDLTEQLRFAYAPATRFIFEIFNLVQRYANYEITNSFLILSLILNFIFIPILIKKILGSFDSALWISLLIGSAGFISALERGNLIILLPCAIAIFILALFKSSDFLLILSSLLIIMIKVQFIPIIYILFLINRKVVFKIFSLYLIFSIPMIYQDGGLRQTYEKTRDALDVNFDYSYSVDALYPINTSLQNTLYRLSNSSNLIDVADSGVIPVFTFIIALTTVSFFALLLHQIQKTRSRRDISFHVLLIYLSIIFYCTNNVYSLSPVYYSIYAPIILYFYIWFSQHEKIDSLLSVLTKTTLSYSTFYFIIPKSSIVLSRFNQDVTVITNYSGYIFHFFWTILILYFLKFLLRPSSYAY